VLVLLGSSATVSAQPAAAPVPPPAGQPAPAPAESPPITPVPPDAVPPSGAAPVPALAAPVPETPGAQGALGVPPKPAAQADAEAAAAPDPASVTEVGVQRLPGYAYPEPVTRGIKHGSLWLTFHGLQWPYMPALGSKSRFVIGVSGWGWVDNAYQKFGPWGNNPAIEQSRIKYWKQQARLLARLTPTYTFDNGFFIQGQVELVGTGDQTISRSDIGGADTDDLWLRFGKWNKWDVMVGRYEGWEVFHLGMGLDLNTFERRGAVGIGEAAYNIQFYGLTDNQFRVAGSAGNAAFHYYPFRFLRFELLNTVGSTTGPMYATRPVAILDLGWVKLKVGTEYQKVVGQQVNDRTDITSKGVGGALQFVPNKHIEFGLNAAQGTIWAIGADGRQDLKGSRTRTSFGGFANVSNAHPRHTLIFGVGSIITTNEAQNDILVPGVVDEYWHYQGFVAAQYVLYGQFYVKLVGGYSRANWKTFDRPISFDDEMYSARLRVSFYF
jgi:hypothetical protein